MTRSATVLVASGGRGVSALLSGDSVDSASRSMSLTPGVVVVSPGGVGVAEARSSSGDGGSGEVAGGCSAATERSGGRASARTR